MPAAKEPIAVVVARNLRYFMDEKGLTEKEVGKRAGMGQTTVGVWLNPQRRQESKSGKPPSGLLGGFQRLADAVEVELWELLRPLSPSERDFYRQVEAAYRSMVEKVSHEAPPPGRRNHDNPAAPSPR